MYRYCKGLVPNAAGFRGGITAHAKSLVNLDKKYMNCKWYQDRTSDTEHMNCNYLFWWVHHRYRTAAENSPLGLYVWSSKRVVALAFRRGTRVAALAFRRGIHIIGLDRYSTRFRRSIHTIGRRFRRSIHTIGLHRYSTRFRRGAHGVPEKQTNKTNKLVVHR